MSPFSCDQLLILVAADSWASMQDLVKDAAPFFKKARKFFDGMAKQLVAQGHALDVFACSLDQVGPQTLLAYILNF